MPRNPNNKTINGRKRVAKEIIKEITSNNPKRISQKEMLIRAGYSPKTAGHKSGEVVNSCEVQEELVKFEDQLEELIQNNIKHAEKKQNKASFRDATDAIDKMSKLKQLITGHQSSESMTVTWTKQN